MTISRRTFLGGTALALCTWSNAASCAAPRRIVDPADFGARGDGVTDDTRALQSCLGLAPDGAIVRLRKGAVYRIDTNYRPTFDTFGGIKLKPGQTLELNGAELKALPSDQPRGAVVQAFDVHDWHIAGPGKITGERSIHRGAGGEWGMGVAINSCRGWSIGPGVEVSNCWGDGIYIDGRGRSGPYSEDFLIDGVHVWNCRRNGFSIIACRNGEIRNSNVHDINGTNPQGGFDFEPDDPGKPNRNIRIRNNKVRNVQVGIYVVAANEDILISGMDIEAVNSGIIVSDYCARVQIVDNPRIANTAGGTEGAAIRTVTGNTRRVKSLHIQRNRLFGGGFFVIDIFDLGYPDLLITHNRLNASNRGVQGIARLGAARFTDNIGVIEPNAGKEGEFYVLFDGVSYGRNRYQNRSSRKMWKLVRHGGSDLGGESYSGPK
jgi:hypothetical protein